MDNSKDNGAQPRDQWGVGSQASAEAFDHAIVSGRVVDLIHGEHPHSRSDNTTYARFRGRDSGGAIVGFDGHRKRIGLKIEEFNYLKESYLSGDEVRKGCTAVISIEGADVYSFGGRTLEDVLAVAPARIRDVESLPVDLSKPDAVRGRKVYYRDVPAVVSNVFDDGRVVLASESGAPFPLRPWDDRDDEWDESARMTVVEDVLASSIWWFRD